MEFQNGLLNLAGREQSTVRAKRCRKLEANYRALPRPRRCLPFNRQCSGERKLVWGVRFLCRSAGHSRCSRGTVMSRLTVLSIAVSKYVESHGQETANRQRDYGACEFTAGRTAAARSAIWFLFAVEMPLDLRDPVERFRYINKRRDAQRWARWPKG